MTKQTISPADAAAQKVLDCKAVVAKLEARLAELADLREKIALERRSLGFQAVAENDPAAQKRIAELRDKALSLGEEHNDTEMATATAQARLRAALEAQGRVGDVERSKVIRAKAAQLRRAGQDATDAATALVRSFKGIESLLGDLRTLGCVNPSRELISVNIKRALLSALFELRRELSIDLVPPGERYTMAEITESWKSSYDRSADILEAGPNNSKAEAA